MRKNIPAHIIFFFLIGIGITVFVIIKASSSGFTHDESFSYLLYPHSSFMEIVTYDNSYANNHILNSLLMKYSELLFGNSEIALRLPNILLLLVYLTYSYFLLRKCNRFLSVMIFLLLCTNILLTDLFGLARGYGLSVGFMFMGLYHLLKSADKQKIRHLILFHLSSMLAVFSNFSLLNFYLASLLIYNLTIFIESRIGPKEKFSFFRFNKVNIIFFIVSFIVLYEPIRRFIKFNVIDFGGKKGFFSDTVTSLIQNMFFSIDISPLLIVILQIIIAIIVVFPLFILVRKISVCDEDFFGKHKGLIITGFLLLFIPLAMVLQHYLFGTNYPVGRFAIFLFPLIALHTGYLLQYVLMKGQRIPVFIALLVLSFISLSIFCSREDLYACAEWKFDSETKNMLMDLSAYRNTAVQEKDSVILGLDWMFEPTVNFYRQTLNLHWLAHADRNGLNENQDYYYIFRDELHMLDTACYKVIREYKKTNTFLLENLRKKENWKNP